MSDRIELQTAETSGLRIVVESYPATGTYGVLTYATRARRYIDQTARDAAEFTTEAEARSYANRAWTAARSAR